MSAFTKITRAVAVAAAAAGVLGVASPAFASTTPPVANNSLYGTWVNTDASSRSVKQVVITPSGSSVTVDAFGSCSPTFCEWGAVPATIYGLSVSSATGANFQTNQAFYSGDTEWSRTTLTGHVGESGSAGPRLTLHELTVFEDGSGRKNYEVTETFSLGRDAKVTKFGNSVTGYRRGAPPALTTAAFGTWKNAHASNSIVKIRVKGTTAVPVVRAYGSCSPSACDFGATKGITYGANISSSVGKTVLAPWDFGFKKTQLVITYQHVAHHRPKLIVSEYNEFTDGSGRANYTKVETFIRV